MPNVGVRREASGGLLIVRSALGGAQWVATGDRGSLTRPLPLGTPRRRITKIRAAGITTEIEVRLEACRSIIGARRGTDGSRP